MLLILVIGLPPLNAMEVSRNLISILEYNLAIYWLADIYIS